MLDDTIPPPPPTWAPPAAAGANLVPGTTGLEYAATLPRGAAWILDSILYVLAAFAVVFAIAIVLPSTLLLTVAALAVSLAYFALGWRSGARATPGMRAMKLQIGRASDGQPLTSGQAIKRWFALVGWTSALALVPALSSAASGLAVIWSIVLFVSVVIGARHQGLHDRICDTAIVRPVGASNTAAWVIVGILAILPIIAIVAIIALIFLGSQVSGILSTVGSSV